MKILIINYRYFISGGPERYMFDLINILEKEGHEVVPFSIKSKRNQITKYEKYFAEPLGGQDEAYFDNMKKTPKMMYDVLERLFYSFSVKVKLRKLIKDTKPDVAYILHHYNKLSPSVIDACKEFNLPIYVRLSDYFLICPQAHMINGKNELCDQCTTVGLQSCITNKCVKNSKVGSFLKVSSLFLHKKILKIYDKVDGFICTNQFMKEKMINDGFNEKKVYIIETFKKNEILEEKKLLNTEKYILYFGRFSHEKAVDTLIYAYLKSKLLDNNIKLYLIGGKLQDLNLKLSQDEQQLFMNNIQIIEFMNKNTLNTYIQNSIYVVQTSRWYENMPNSILEAFSFKKAVITANIGSLKYLIEDRITGLLYEYENIDDLSFKLNKLAMNEKLRNEIEFNVEKSFEKYSEKIHYEKLIKLMEEK